MELTDAELIHFAAYFSVQAEEDERAAERAKLRRH